MWTPSSVGRTGTIHSSAVAIRWPLTCLTPSPGLHPSSPSPYQWQTLAISDSEPSRPADDHGTPCTRIRVHRRRSSRVPGHHGGLPSVHLPASRTIQDQSWRAPTPGWKSGQDHEAPYGTAGRCRWHPGAVAAHQLGAASALGSSPSSLVVGVCPGAGGAVAPAVPARVCAVLRIAHRRTLARTGVRPNAAAIWRRVLPWAYKSAARSTSTATP
jgi:hypothetical protein